MEISFAYRIYSLRVIFHHVFHKNLCSSREKDENRLRQKRKPPVLKAPVNYQTTFNNMNAGEKENNYKLCL